VSLKDSLDLIRLVRPQAGTAALEHEILAEKASSLGLTERRVRASLAGLEGAAEAERGEWLAEARKRVWAYFVQRELCGFRRHTDVIQDLKIPPEVLSGVGMLTNPPAYYRRRR
jgi:hypothetical protein